MKIFTFKKEKKETGLAAVGYPYPDTQIKHKKKIVGIIQGPNWQSKNNQWRIKFMIAVENQKNQFEWIKLKYIAPTEQDARSFLQQYGEEILKKFNLYHIEPNSY